MHAGETDSTGKWIGGNSIMSDENVQEPASAQESVEAYLDWLGIKSKIDRRKFLSRMGKSVLALGAVGALPGILAACGPSAATPAPTTAPAAGAPAVQGATAPPAASKSYRVAFIIFVNNPYWKQIQAQVEKLLKPRLARQGVTVDLVNATAKANAVDMSAAIDSAVAQQYNGIIVAGIAPSMAPAVNRAMKANIPVFTFCCDVADSDRMAYYGNNSDRLGSDAAKLMLEGLQKENILEKRGLKDGVIGIETAIGFTDLVNRSDGFKKWWEANGLKNVTLLPYIDVQDDAQLVYSKARDTIAANPNLVGLYVSTGSQYALGNAIVEANKVGQIIGIAHEVFQDTLQVMKKGGLWAVNNDAPIGQAIKPGDDMAKLLLTGQKPAQAMNYSEDLPSKYFVYATDTAWIDEELQHWDQLLNGCADGCPDLLAKEMKQ
jgi:ABC-type sugar transport system substrate-binding protein